MSHLIQEILKGDRRAQGRFYDEFSPLVMGICVRYMKSHEAASDVFQEAFVKIFNNLGKPWIISERSGMTMIFRQLEMS
ncbi:RNA polymerase sigma factor [Marinoscillum sp.]|uniref:RNA polymerase sigma factor n=1 Tax=Marinoscillum sp. TaxID=2024838 RepID=UPI003BABAF45